MPDVVAEQFIGALIAHGSDDERQKIDRYFKADDRDNLIIGVRMRTIFDLAKKNRDMPLEEIEVLLESCYYEARMGAVSIMDFQTRLESTTEERRKALHDMYLARHDRINNWDLVDRAAPNVVGGYLYQYTQPRDELYDLAESQNPWERRTAIVATAYFIRQDEVEDTFNIARQLRNDQHDLVQKAVGSWLRQAGKRDEKRFLVYLNEHAATMGRTELNAAIKDFDQEEKNRLRKMRKNGAEG